MPNNQKHDWNNRYSAEEYVYGTDPNEYFKQKLDKLTPGRLLLIAEGEGRNAVYAAKNKWQVDAVDWSEQARKKALALAEKENVIINYDINDLNEFIPSKETYDAVGIVYVHMHRDAREKIFGRMVDSLKPGGLLIMEVFSTRIEGTGRGGPKEVELRYDINEMPILFPSLEILDMQELIVDLKEGDLHQGDKVVARFTGRKK